MPWMETVPVEEEFGSLAMHLAIGLRCQSCVLDTASVVASATSGSRDTKKADDGGYAT